ncbi:MAG TPA: ferredoxin:glutaredoxin reductase [candidate division Zixibacteria bacterium]|jgi:ferredoxin-thioredoxin reductase catalytic subunit|nr:ferredoxin:glutaredoxin reductase [candidate division Zixibacteria bacterium]
MRTAAEIEAEILKEAEADGCRLNPDREITEGIIEGIAANEENLGYWRCPCRMSPGDRIEDLDIICPCEYRDPDLRDFGRCYCALYVTRDYLDRGSPTDPIPERRPPRKAKMRRDETAMDMGKDDGQGPVKTWRCTVCGYLCARSGPPPICPICRAKRERFEEFRPC